MSLSTPDLLASKDWYINLLDIPHDVTINHSENLAWTDHTPGISPLHLAFKMLSWNPSGSSGVLGISSTGLLDCVCLVTQLCPTLCDPTDSSPPGSSVHRDSSGKNTGVGCHALLQRIFLTRDRTQVSTLQADSWPSEPPGKPGLRDWCPAINARVSFTTSQCQ